MKQGNIFLFSFILVLMFYATAQAQYKCVEGDCVNGKGKQILDDGREGSLEGEFADGALVSGKVVFPGGDVFEGQFVNNKLVQGTKRYKDGRIMEGKFFASVLIEGKITEANGSVRQVRLKRMGGGFGSR